MKTLKYLGFLTIVFMMATVFMGIYTIKPRAVSVTEWGGGGIIRFDFAFVAATDTAYFPFTVPRPHSGSDSVWYSIDLGVAPAVSFGTADSSNVYFGFQTSDDNVNWNTLVRIRQDSAATGTAGVFIFHNFNYVVGESSGCHPYNRIVVIGETPSGGKANEIGNQVIVYCLRQYNY